MMPESRLPGFNTGESAGSLPPRRRLVVLLCSALVGAFVGVATKAADAAESQWVRDVANSPAVFVFAIALVAWLSPGPVAAALRAGLFFTAMCFAYYAWSSELFGVGGGRFVVVWTVASLTIVPAAAAALRWAFVRSGVLPVAIIGTAAGTTLAGFGEVRQLWYFALGRLPEGFQLHPVQAVVRALLAVIVAGLLPRNRSTRLGALLVLAPAGRLMARLVDRLYSVGLFA